MYIKDWFKPIFTRFPTFLTPIVDLSSPPASFYLPSYAHFRRRAIKKKGRIETNIVANYIRCILNLLQLDIRIIKELDLLCEISVTFLLNWTSFCHTFLRVWTVG